MNPPTNDTPTPETDAQNKEGWIVGESLVSAEFARSLERRLAQATADALDMEFRLKQAEQRNIEHESDYLAVWKEIKQPNETVLQAVRRVVRNRAESERKLADSLNTHTVFSVENAALRAKLAVAREALDLLYEEYDDRKSQFSGDILWRKHEDKESIEFARKTIKTLAATGPETKSQNETSPSVDAKEK